MEMTRTTFIRRRSDTIKASASRMFDLAVVYSHSQAVSRLKNIFVCLQPPNEVLIWPDTCGGKKQRLAGIIGSIFAKLRRS